MKKLFIFGLVMILLSSFAFATYTPANDIFHLDVDGDTNSIKDYTDTSFTNSGVTIVNTDEMDFDGSDTIYYANGLYEFDTEDFTINVWADTDDTTIAPFFSSFGTGDFNRELVLNRNTNEYFDITVYSTTYSNYLNTGNTQGSSINTYYMITATRDSTTGTVSLFIDGSFIGSYAGGVFQESTLAYYIGYYTRGGNYLNGQIKSIFATSDVLTTGEISDLYDLGEDYNPYVEGNIFELTASNLYNGSNIESFNATITNETTSQTILTSNSSVFWKTNDMVNITVRSLNYFEKTFTNINTSNDLEAELYQAVLYTYAIQNYTNNTISNFNLTVGSQFNTSSSAYTTHYLNADTYSYTANAEEHNYNSTGSLTFAAQETKNITIGFIPFALNVAAKEYFANSTINNFTVQVISDYYTSNYTTTTGSLLVYGVNGTYNLTIITDDYADESILFNITQDGLNKTFYLYEKNSMYFQIYNQETGSLISESVAITLIDDIGQTTYYTSNGTLFLNNITPDDYTITFESSSYSKATYYATVSQGSTQTLNAYLLNASVIDSVTFTIKDFNGGSDLEDATISISRVVGGDWALINVLTSDITGRAAFLYSTGEEYRFVVSKSGYLDKTFKLNPILFETYVIKIEKDISEVSDTDYSGITLVYSPSIFYDATNNNITFLFADPTGSLEYYGYKFTYDTLIANDTGANAYGQQFYDNLTITGATYSSIVTLEYYYKTTSGSEKNFEFIYFVSGIAAIDNSMISNRGKTYGLGELERVLVSDLIVILVAGSAAMFAGPIAAALMAFAAFGFLITIGFLNFWAGVISMIILFILVAWRSSQ